MPLVPAELELVCPSGLRVPIVTGFDGGEDGTKRSCP